MSHSRPLKDVCALWPEVRWPVANILCEGPSIRDLDPRRLRLGPTIAVNRAIATPNVPIDFWATSDDPRLLWAWAEPFRHKKLRYFSTDQNVGIWLDLLGANLPKLYSVHMTPMGRDEKGLAVILPTVLPVLGWLLRCGVTKVRIFGADMLGMGSPISGDWKSNPDAEWHGRWIIERTLFSHAARTYRARGSRIERWSPAKNPPALSPSA